MLVVSEVPSGVYLLFGCHACIVRILVSNSHEGFSFGLRGVACIKAASSLGIAQIAQGPECAPTVYCLNACPFLCFG